MGMPRDIACKSGTQLWQAFNAKMTGHQRTTHTCNSEQINGAQKGHIPASRVGFLLEPITFHIARNQARQKQI